MGAAVRPGTGRYGGSVGTTICRVPNERSLRCVGCTDENDCDSKNVSEGTRSLRSCGSEFPRSLPDKNEAPGFAASDTDTWSSHRLMQLQTWSWFSPAGFGSAWAGSGRGCRGGLPAMILSVRCQTFKPCISGSTFGLSPVTAGNQTVSQRSVTYRFRPEKRGYGGQPATRRAPLGFPCRDLSLFRNAMAACRVYGAEGATHHHCRECSRCASLRCMHPTRLLSKGGYASAHPPARASDGLRLQGSGNEAAIPI